MSERFLKLDAPPEYFAHAKRRRRRGSPSDSRQAILTVLRDTSDLMTPNEIAAGTRLTRNNIDQLLFRMLSDGEAKKPSRGHYVSAEREEHV